MIHAKAPAPAPPRPSLPRAVVWLGVVSLLTDASTELIYPLIPLFLTTVLGAPASFVGAVEGVAETTASLLKLVSGWLADRAPRKKPLTLVGYGIASAVRPLVALATAPWMVLAIRFVDRIGKGVRSSPRDALIADATPPDRRGDAFGYHSAMDNVGAVVGPLLGFALVSGLHVSLRVAFACAAVPAGLAMLALAFGVKEEPNAVAAATGGAADDGAKAEATSAKAVRAATAPATPPAMPPATPIDPALVTYLGAVALFTLGNASDAFLLLRARAAGVATAHIILLWALHNAVKALLGRWLGGLSDRVGRRWLIGGGWLLYGATYLAFGLATHTWQIWALFAIYGLYYALVEGSEKALVADLAGKERRGRAYGWFYAVTGLLALPSSLLFGALYADGARPLLAFGVCAACATAATALLAFTGPARPRPAAAAP